MHIIRLLTRQLSLLLFGSLLVALPVVTAIVLTFGNPDTVKNTANESGVYSVFVASVLSESASQSKDQNAKQVLQNEGVRAAATTAFTPEVLRGASESLIDGTYNWLTQKTSSLQFTIDLTKPKQQFVAGLNDYAVKRASSLPRCSLEQLQKLQNAEDILSIPCLPAGVDPNKAAQDFSQDFVDNADFLKDPIITATDLPKDEQGRTFDEQASSLPAIYSTIKAAPWLIGGLAIVVGLCTILLFEDRRVGTRRIAWSLFGTGLLLLVALLIYSFLLRNFANSSLGISDPAFREAAADALTTLLGTYLKYVGMTGAAYVGIASVLLFAQSRFKPQPVIGDTPPAAASSEPATSHHAEAHESTSAETPEQTDTKDNQDETKETKA